MIHAVGSKVRRRVDVPGGVVVVLQRALKRIWCCRSAGRAGLLRSNAADLVAHQAIIVLVRLLATPDAERDQGETGQDDKAGYSDNNTNDSVLGLGADACGAVSSVTGQGAGTGWRGRRGGGGSSGR